MATKKTFEQIARDLREAKVLGLFLNDRAHAIVVGNIADALEKMNPRFDGERFATASGVKMVDHSNDVPVHKVCPNSMARKGYRPVSEDEYTEAVQSIRESASLRFASAGNISHDDARHEVMAEANLSWDLHLDDMEIDGPDCN